MQTTFSKISVDSVYARLKKTEQKKASDECVQRFKTAFINAGYQNRNEKLFDILARLGASELEKTTTKGIVIKGDPGVGKTVGLELLAKWMRWEVVTAPEVEGFFKKQPSREEWEDYCRACDYFGRPKTLVIDDLGTESYPFFFYGQEGNPLQDLLEIRYRLSFLRDNTRTIITTNLTDAELLQRYGFRIIDRFNEMCSIVVIKGESLRK